MTDINKNWELAKMTSDCVDIADKALREILIYLLTNSDPMPDTEIIRLMTAAYVPIMAIGGMMRHDQRIALMMSGAFGASIEHAKTNPFKGAIEDIRNAVAATNSEADNGS